MLVNRFQLPAFHLQLATSFSFAKLKPLQWKILRLQQHLVAAESAYNVAYSTASQILSTELIDFFVTMMNPFLLLIEESRRYLETSLPMVRLRPSPTFGKTETPQEGIDGSDREGEGEVVISGSGGGGGVERGGDG